MKKVILKKWLDNLLKGVASVSSMLIAITIDSDFTLGYFLFLGIDITILVGSVLILKKYGRPMEED